MVEPKEVKIVIDPGKLAVGLEKAWIMCNSLVQQIGRLEQISFLITAEIPGEHGILGAAIKIKRSEIGGWRSFNLQLFKLRLWREVAWLLFARSPRHLEHRVDRSVDRLKEPAGRKR